RAGTVHWSGLRSSGVRDERTELREVPEGAQHVVGADPEVDEAGHLVHAGLREAFHRRRGLLDGTEQPAFGVVAVERPLYQGVHVALAQLRRVDPAGGTGLRAEQEPE